MARDAQKRTGELQRQCAVTRARLDAADLLRFVVDPEGFVVPDIAGRLPGRGVWISCDRQILDQAVTANVFSRSLRTQAKLRDNLSSQTAGLLERDCLQRLSLANKAGSVTCGFDKVSKALKRNSVAALLHASDAAADGKNKLDRIFRAVTEGDAAKFRIVESFNAEQLSLALGQPNVVHAALKHGGPCDKFLLSTARLQKFMRKDGESVAA